jgi:uroporphyrinogen decarboxylase
MKHRERVISSLSHEEPDQIPISIGGSANKFTDSRHELLKQYFGIVGESPKRLTGAYLSYVDNRLLDAFDTSIRYVHLRPPGNYQLDLKPDGTFTDEWGLTHITNELGVYQLVGMPLAKATIDDLESYPWPNPYDPARVRGLREEAAYLYHNTDCAIAAYRPTISGIFELSHYMRGIEQLLMDTVLEQDFVDALFTKLTEVLIGFYQVYINTVGPYIQIIELADDLGTQNGPMISPKTYRKLLKDKHARIIESVKQTAPHVKFLLHSCGSVKAFIPDFIEAGFDILNPIQTQARDMNPTLLKKEFGCEISFLGGVDVQQTMRGPVAGVIEEVRLRIEELSPRGGYIIAPSHNFGDDIPLENILAFFNAAHDFG